MFKHLIKSKWFGRIFTFINGIFEIDKTEKREKFAFSNKKKTTTLNKLNITKIDNNVTNCLGYEITYN